MNNKIKIKLILKKILSFFKLYNVIGRILFLIKNRGLVIGLYYFFIIDTFKFLFHKIFDYYWHIDTCRIIESKDLDIKENEQKDSFRYQAVSINHLSISLNYLLCNNNSKYDFFLDIGCGMGRPSFFATKYYPRINKFIGIDVSEKMTNLAIKNLKTFKNRNNVPKKNILFKNINAINYTLEEKKCIIFLFNPFSEKYLKIFFEKNKKIIKTSKSKIIFVNQSSTDYLNKNFDQIFSNNKIALKIYQ